MGRCFIGGLGFCQEMVPTIADVCRKVGDKGHVPFHEKVCLKEYGEVQAWKGVHVTAGAINVSQDGILKEPLGGVEVDESLPAWQPMDVTSGHPGKGIKAKEEWPVEH